MYNIEIWNSAGDELIQVLKNAHDIVLEETVNAPKILTFSLPATDRKLHYITKANEIWVRDTGDDSIVVKTKLLRQEDIH